MRCGGWRVLAARFVVHNPNIRAGAALNFVIRLLFQMAADNGNGDFAAADVALIAIQHNFRRCSLHQKAGRQSSDNAVFFMSYS